MLKNLPATIKLLAIDIDGTLLNPEGQITPATRAAVHAAQQAGVIVTLATARRYCNTTEIAAELGLTIPLILYDGALIAQHPEGHILDHTALPSEVAAQAIQLLTSHGIQPVVQPLTGLDHEEIWTGPTELDSLWQEAYFATYPEQMRRMNYSALSASSTPLLRVVGFAAEEAIDSLLPETTNMNCTIITIKRGSYGSAELGFMPRGCSKAYGVATLARSLGIEMVDVMAIGDNNNDIALLSSAGWGVAMGQASPAVQAVAAATTASNSEDGVARAIEDYVLGRAITADSNSRSRAICL